MLHILLILLQLIGWIFLVILGILVLMICIILFTPFRYRGEGKSPGTLQETSVDFRLSWLCSLLQGRMMFRKETLSWQIRIGWKTFSSEGEIDKEKKHEEADFTKMRYQLEHSEKAEKKTQSSKPAETVTFISSKRRMSASDTTEEQSVKKRRKKAREFFGKIKYTFQSVCDTIKTLKKKKEIIFDFFTDEIHRAALQKLLNEMKRTFRYLMPRKGRIRLEYGFEDPASTGYLLAGISLLYPWIGSYSEIRPNFEEKVFRGDFFAAGRIRLVHVFMMLWRLILNREVRTTCFHGRRVLKKLQR